MRDAGNLLGAGGFALPSVDTDEIEMKYTDVLDLVQHLRVRRPLALPLPLISAALLSKRYQFPKNRHGAVIKGGAL